MVGIRKLKQIKMKKKKKRKKTHTIMTVDTMSEKSNFSKWFLTSKAPYSKPCFRFSSFLDKNNDTVRSAVLFLKPHSSTRCKINFKIHENFSGTLRIIEQ